MAGASDKIDEIVGEEISRMEMTFLEWWVKPKLIFTEIVSFF